MAEMTREQIADAIVAELPTLRDAGALAKAVRDAVLKHLPKPPAMDWTWNGAQWLSNPPGYRISIGLDALFRVRHGDHSVIGNPSGTFEDAKAAAEQHRQKGQG